MYDLAIIGAGPAGATLARLVGDGYKVLCLDRRPLSDRSEGFSSGKCCGGLLAPDAQKMLSQLGLGLPKSILEGPQLFEGGRNHFPYFTSIFDPEITDYYCWTIPKGEHLIIGAALQPAQRPSEKFERLKMKMKAYSFQFGKTLRREGAIILRPMKAKQLFTGEKGMALIGEAAGWISPSSAEGLSYALKSALLLAEVLRPTPIDFERRYYEKTKPLRRNIFLKQAKSHFIFNPTLRKAVMRSGPQSMKIYIP